MQAHAHGLIGVIVGGHVCERGWGGKTRLAGKLHKASYYPTIIFYKFWGKPTNLVGET